MGTTKKLKNWLDQFPSDTTCWGDATDEIREMTRRVRMEYNDTVASEKGLDEILSLNYSSFSPSDWNTQSKKMIFELWPKLSDRSKKYVLSYI